MYIFAKNKNNNRKSGAVQPSVRNVQQQASSAKKQPPKKGRGGKSNQQTNLERVLPVPRQQVVNNGALSNAIKAMVTNILAPTTSFRLPRPTGPLVAPALYRSLTPLTAVDNATPLRVVIKINMDFRKHIQIFSNAAAVTYTNIGYRAASSGHSRIIFRSSKEMLAGNFYSFPSELISEVVPGSTQTVYANAQLLKAEGWSFPVWAYDPSNDSFKENYVWVMPATINSASHPVTADAVVGTAANPEACVFRLAAANIVAESATQGGYSDTSIAAGAISGTNSGAVSTAFALFYGCTETIVADQVLLDLDNFNSTYSGPQEIDIPISFSSAFKALILTSQKVSLSALQVKLAPPGGCSTSGIIASALVPYGTHLSNDAQICIQQISKLPDHRSYEGNPSEGTHISWVPDTIDQWFLKPAGPVTDPTFSWNEEYATQQVVIAMDIPAAGSMQIPLFHLTTAINVEAENYDPVYGAASCGNASLLMTALIDSLGEARMCSGNPNHMKKIADAVKKVYNDPTVRMLASTALKAGKILAPTLLAL